jgi:hypothetical protein
MPGLEKIILEELSGGERRNLRRFRDYIVDEYDSSQKKVEDALLELEKNEDIFRPGENRIQRLDY